MIGIDAYWPLSKASTTDVPVLQQSWEPIRAELAAVFGEVRPQDPVHRGRLHEPGGHHHGSL